MKYLCLIYDEEAKLAGMSKAGCGTWLVPIHWSLARRAVGLYGYTVSIGTRQGSIPRPSPGAGGSQRIRSTGRTAGAGGRGSPALSVERGPTWPRPREDGCLVGLADVALVRAVGFLGRGNVQQAQ